MVVVAVNELSASATDPADTAKVSLTPRVWTEIGPTGVAVMELPFDTAVDVNGPPAPVSVLVKVELLPPVPPLIRPEFTLVMALTAGSVTLPVSMVTVYEKPLKGLSPAPTPELSASSTAAVQLPADVSGTGLQVPAVCSIIRATPVGRAEKPEKFMSPMSQFRPVVFVIVVNSVHGAALAIALKVSNATENIKSFFM